MVVDRRSTCDPMERSPDDPAHAAVRSALGSSVYSNWSQPDNAVDTRTSGSIALRLVLALHLSLAMHDVVIAGGGIAGMATAARLSARGFKTLVLEAHGQVGG